MNAEISVFVIWVEAITYLLLYNLHDCTLTTKTPCSSVSIVNFEHVNAEWDISLHLNLF